MKGYLVNIENNEFENYLIYLDDIPSYDKNKNQWFGFGEPIVVDKEHISLIIKALSGNRKPTFTHRKTRKA